MTDLGLGGRALLDAARHADDDEMMASRERVRSALGRRIGAAAVGLTTVTAATTATAGATASIGVFTKVVVGLVAIGVVAGGVAVTRERKPTPPIAATTAPIAPAPRVLPEPTSVLAPAPTTTTITPVVEPEPAPTAPTTPTTPPMPTPPMPTPIVAPIVKPAPQASTFGEEVAALRSANEKLVGGKPGEALAILDAAPATGTLGEERAGLRLVARCALGDPQARPTARAFLDSHPSSPLAARLRSTCGLD